MKARYGNFDIDLELIIASRSSIWPDTLRVICSTQCPCLSDADWCLQSDGIPDSRLLTWA